MVLLTVLGKKKTQSAKTIAKIKMCIVRKIKFSNKGICQKYMMLILRNLTKAAKRWLSFCWVNAFQNE